MLNDILLFMCVRLCFFPIVSMNSNGNAHQLGINVFFFAFNQQQQKNKMQMFQKHEISKLYSELYIEIVSDSAEW